MRNLFPTHGAAARRAALAALLGAALAGDACARGLTQSQLARLDPATETTSVLLESIKELLKNEQLEDALPFLKEALVRLEGDGDKLARQTMGFTLYQLADCQMKLGEYLAAARNFARFADEFPGDPQAPSARVLAAQCLTLLQQWPGAEEQAAAVFANPRLDDATKAAAAQLLSEALYQQEKWGEAVAPLATLFRMAKVDTVRAGTAVMLATCYVRLNDFPNLFRFLPHCDEAARHDVGLNVALLEGGDAHYNRGEYQKALLLYRQVLLKRELAGHYEARIRDVRQAMQPFAADGKQTLAGFKEQQRRNEELLARLVRHYEAITAFPDYDLEVGLRLAQCYGDLKRNWPAHAIYRGIHAADPAAALADRALFAAFACMLDEREWPLAIAEGHEYVETFPGGEFIDDATLNLMQVHLQQERPDLAYGMGERALALSPGHRYIDQVKFLMGYVRFIQLDYAPAAELFGEVLASWPESRYREAAEYWRAMALLFSSGFEEAVAAFGAYLDNPAYDPPAFAEDAFYRLGIAQYGARLYEESESTFRLFVEKHPGSLLVSEAYAMLGDLRAAEGDLEVALGFYRLAREKAASMAQVNYPLFQAAAVLELEKKYGEIIALMDGYLGEWAEAGDIAAAARWKGTAFKARDEYPRVLDAYFDAADRYGGSAETAGLDLLADEVAADCGSPEWEGYRDLAAEKIRSRLGAARRDGRRSLELWYLALLSHLVPDGERAALVAEVAQPRNIPAAGRKALVLIAREGVAQGDYGMVHEAFDRYMSTFEVSMGMFHVMGAALDALVAEGRHEEALALSDEILSRFGYARPVGETRMKRGDAFRLMGRYELAIEAYGEILGIREWRGALTPQALYRIGVCKLALGEPAEAFAYFQRVYVLYEEHLDWVAKAYAKSIECLEILGGRKQEIINTCKEMLADPRLAATPEGRAARRRLRELEPPAEARP